MARSGASSESCVCFWSESAIARRPWSCGSGSTSRRTGVDVALRALSARGSVREAIVLSTCNRGGGLRRLRSHRDRPAPMWSTFISRLPRHRSGRRCARTSTIASDLDVARHLFRVAAGLDSLVVGEPQILGQVKDAHAAGGTAQTVGPVLNRLFHSSFGVGKRVRTETALGSGAVSVSFAAVALARKIFGELNGTQRAGRRRRRNGQAHRAAHAVAGRASG